MSSTNLQSKINSNESDQIPCDIDAKTSTENEKIMITILKQQHENKK